jgi:hypothetical protein
MGRGVPGELAARGLARVAVGVGSEVEDTGDAVVEGGVGIELGSALPAGLVLAVSQGCSGPGEATEYQPPAIGVEELGGTVAQSPAQRRRRHVREDRVGRRKGIVRRMGVPFCV